MSIAIIKKTSVQNTTYSAGRSHKYIVIHYTAGVSSKSGSAISSASWFANPAAQASADFIVDDESIVQFNADIDNRYCWAVGGKKYNTKGGSLYGTAKNSNVISIEICSTNKTGKVTNPNDSNWSFTNAAVNKAVELTKYLMEKYNIDANHVIRHYDVNGKPCPGIIGWNEDTGDTSQWESFKARISGGASVSKNDVPQTGTPSSSASTKETKVKVKVSDLNYRATPSMQGKVLGQTGKGIFTVTEIQNGWGKLKSGAGWIYLNNKSYIDIL